MSVTGYPTVEVQSRTKDQAVLRSVTTPETVEGYAVVCITMESHLTLTKPSH